MRGWLSSETCLGTTVAPIEWTEDRKIEINEHIAPSEAAYIVDQVILYYIIKSVTLAHPNCPNNDQTNQPPCYDRFWLQQILQATDNNHRSDKIS